MAEELPLRIAVIAGSLRQASYNKILSRHVVQLIQDKNHEATFVDLRDYALPLYDGDIEATAFPEAATRLQQLLKQQDGLIFFSPEYNSAISAALKNAIDWSSRDGQGGGDLGAYWGKPALLFAASLGALGGLRGLVALRSILGNIGSYVVPDQLAVPKVHEAVDGTGRLINDGVAGSINRMVDDFLTFSRKMVQPGGM